MWPRAVALTLVCSGSSTAFARSQAVTSTPQSAIDRFAEILVKASPTEREKLLADAPSSITPELLSRLTELGTRSYNRDQYEAARDAFRVAEEIAAALHDEKAAARMLVNRGRVEIVVNDFSRAREYLERAREMSRRIGDNAGVARAFNYLALVETRVGDLERALEKRGGTRHPQRIGDVRDVPASAQPRPSQFQPRSPHRAIALYRPSLDIRRSATRPAWARR